MRTVLALLPVTATAEQAGLATTQIATTIQQVAANAQVGARGAAMAAQTARNGSKTVETTIQGMTAISLHRQTC